jgi:small subunit ribosomal protein S1
MSQLKEWTLPNGEFDWDGYESTCPKVLRTPNPHVKVKDPKHKVFCREPYAQEMYNIYEGHISENDIITKIEYGETYAGKIYSVSGTTVTVDIGYRQLIFINLEKEDEAFRNLSPDDEVEVTVTSDIENDKLHISGSISEGMRKKTFQEMFGAIETQDTAWVGVVNMMMEEAGYIVTVNGINCFMPGSLAGINKLHDFNSIVDSEIYVVPVSYSKERRSLVVSHRAYLKTLIPEAVENLKETQGEDVTGTVTGSAKYGVFCEFNKCLTGMIHVNDLEGDTLIRHKNQEIKPGEEITFKVKDIISNTKITLTQLDNIPENPWNNIDEKYKVPSVVKAKVKTCKDYGLFVEIESGVVGLLHVSEIGVDNIKNFKPKDKINVVITRIEEETKKVFLKLPS